MQRPYNLIQYSVAIVSYLLTYAYPTKTIACTVTEQINYEKKFYSQPVEDGTFSCTILCEFTNYGKLDTQ